MWRAAYPSLPTSVPDRFFSKCEIDERRLKTDFLCDFAKAEEGSPGDALSGGVLHTFRCLL